MKYYLKNIIRNFATIEERGLAAEMREKYKLPRIVLKDLHNIIHEKHSRKTSIIMPCISFKKYKIKKDWLSK